MRRLLLLAGLVILAGVWLGPLPALARHAFWAHMTIHMAVVAVAAPLLAIALAGSRYDPVRLAPAVVSPVPASIFELVGVWMWHTPLLHHAARANIGIFALEQVTFLAAGLVLWLAVVGGDDATRRWRAAAGVGAMLFTSIHMTLLGALFALTPRVLYAHPPADAALAFSPLFDQHLGGAIMLLVGGLSYLSGGLWLLTAVLRGPQRS